jgi:hypothetical protein
MPHMKHYFFLACLIAGAIAWVGCQSPNPQKQGSASGAQLAHMVYFTLKDNSPAQKANLVRECHQFLKNHPGVVYFAAGVVADDLQRPVNVRDFDVSLHVVFRNRQAHDDYQKAAQHLKFIERNQLNWKQVRVFDSDLRQSTTPIP